MRTVLGLDRGLFLHILPGILDQSILIALSLSVCVFRSSVAAFNLGNGLAVKVELNVREL